MLCSLLQHHDEEVRLEAAWALQRFKAEAVEVTSALRKFIRADGGGRDQNCAAYALFKLTGDAPPALRVFRHNLISPTGEKPYERHLCKWHSLWMLGELGEKATAAAEDIRALTKGVSCPEWKKHLDDSRAVKLGNRAMFSLFCVTRDAAPALAMYCHQLRCRDDWIRESGVTWLGMLGSDAEGALPQLRQALRDPYSSARHEAYRAIRRIQAGPEDE